jgi:hypothetical protein
MLPNIQMVKSVLLIVKLRVPAHCNTVPTKIPTIQISNILCLVFLKIKWLSLTWATFEDAKNCSNFGAKQF